MPLTRVSSTTHIPVLIGPQGVGKSYGARVAVAGRTPHPVVLRRVTAFRRREAPREALQGAVIVEFAVLIGATTADIESIKAFLSRTSDHVRLAFREEPRALPTALLDRWHGERVGCPAERSVGQSALRGIAADRRLGLHHPAVFGREPRTAMGGSLGSCPKWRGRLICRTLFVDYRRMATKQAGPEHNILNGLKCARG